jgi:hypothetical protein
MSQYGTSHRSEVAVGLKPSYDIIESGNVAEHTIRPRKLELRAMFATACVVLVAAADMFGSCAIGKENAIPKGLDSNGCDLCKDHDWVFVLGTGRSGSTSVIEMVNTIPGVFLAGENFGQVLQMREMYDSTVKIVDVYQSL